MVGEDMNIDLTSITEQLIDALADASIGYGAHAMQISFYARDGHYIDPKPRIETLAALLMQCQRVGELKREMESSALIEKG